jgi:hypothetical protein
MPISKRTTLAIHSGALGDLILFGHLLKAVGGSITLVSGGQKARLLAGLGAADRAIDFDLLPMHEIFLEDRRCEKLSSLLGKTDYLISCYAAGDERAADALVRACGAAEAHFLPVRPPEDFPGHLTDLWTEALGISPLSRTPPPWPVPAEWQQQARQLLNRSACQSPGAADIADGNYVLMHPGAGSPQKRWPIANFLELAGVLRRRCNWPAVFIIGPAEQEQFSLSDMAMLQKAGPVLTSPPLSILAGLAAGAKAMIGNDSGPTHLAAAIGLPTAVFFGPTRAENFAPLGRGVTVIPANTINCDSIRQMDEIFSPLAGGD